MTSPKFYVRASAPSLARLALGPEGVGIGSTKGLGDGIIDELRSALDPLSDAQKQYTADCFDSCAEGQCGCPAASLEDLREAVAGGVEATARLLDEMQSCLTDDLQIGADEVAEHTAYAAHEIWYALANDVATICAWGRASGAGLLALRCEIEDPTLNEMIRSIHMAEFTAHEADSPLARFRDALEDLRDGELTAAEGVMRRWLEQTAEGEGAEGAGVPDAPSLEAFCQELRGYQQGTLDDAAEFLESCWSEAPPLLQRQLYASPCGTGKGTIELALLRGLREQDVDAWILTPSLEVLRGFLERCGAGDLSEASGEQLAAMGEGIFCTTPVRMRNRILDGARQTPEVVIYDEVHHAIDTGAVAGTLFAVAPDAVWLGFTATPYRASPRATAQLHEDWGVPIEVLSIPQAIEQELQALPEFRVVPLVDDDEVKIVSGEFQVRQMEKLYGGRIGALADLIVEAFDFGALPTAVAVPSSEVASMLVSELDERGVDGIWIHQKTPASERAKAYELCRLGTAVLLSIRVLGEGVDFPWLRQLIDARPTISPVAWLQLIGRVMRPGEQQPRVICTNRNLERHAYLLQGSIPRSAIVQAQEAFEKPSKRAGTRQIGLESLARFKAIPLPLEGGLVGSMYCVHSIAESGVKTEYVTLLDPSGAAPITATRSVLGLKTGEKKRGKGHYGAWRLCGLPQDFSGFATSQPRGAFSEKQKAWWERDARRHGLRPSADGLTRRQFQALPVLSNTRVNMLGGNA